LEPSQRPFVAIIGPFYNSEKYVKGWLNAVSLQTYPNFKLYLVDDASADTTASILEDEVAKLGVPAEIIALTENQGPSAARNIAIRKSIEEGAEIVILLDADCRVEPDWIHRHVDFHLNFHEVSILGGSIQGKASSAVGIADGFCSWFTAVPGSASGAVKKLHLSSTNMSLKRGVFERIGYFDEALATGEDVAFCRKAQQAGLVLWMQSNIVVTHLDRNDFPSAKRHHYRWGLHSYTLSLQAQGGYYGALKKLNRWGVLALVPVIAGLNTVLIVVKFTRSRPYVWLYLPWIFVLKVWNAIGVYHGYLNPKLCLRLKPSV